VKRTHPLLLDLGRSPKTLRSPIDVTLVISAEYVPRTHQGSPAVGHFPALVVHTPPGVLHTSAHGQTSRDLTPDAHHDPSHRFVLGRALGEGQKGD